MDDVTFNDITSTVLRIIKDKKIFHRDFLHYICSYRLGNPICNITGNDGLKETTVT